MNAAGHALFGADETVVPLQWHDFGDWRLALGSGELRYLSHCGQEVLRGVAFLARDANWGVHPCMAGRPEMTATGTGLRIDWQSHFGPPDAPALTCRFNLHLTQDHVLFSVDGRLSAGLLTARTGFVLLHPIEGFAGRPLTVRSPDGSLTEGVVPEKVSPGQPFRDIRTMSFELPGDGARIKIDLEAEHAFEMEDQRNWTDASFKTYYRPLALEWPYELAAGEQVRQSVTIRADARREPQPIASAPQPAPTSATGTAPHIGLVWLDADEAPLDLEALRALGTHRLTAQLDVRRGPDARLRATQAAALARNLGLPLHLRLVLPDAGDPLPSLNAIAAAAGAVTSVHALPAAFLKSHQPEGPWPDGLSCAEAMGAARLAFPGAEMVEGMLTFFTELNRHPPRAGGDAVSFGTAAIVHAADDRSVMETLEALPAVFATAADLAGERPVEIGLAALALWTNPYGKALVANPDWTRRAMTDRDPRLRGMFGAAWLVGYLAHATAAGIRSVGVGCVSGPLGLLPGEADGDDWHSAFPGARLRPAAHAARAFASLGATVTAIPPRRAGDTAILIAGHRALLANTGPEPAAITLAGQRITAARVLEAAILAEALKDIDWLSGPPAPLLGALTLPPYAVALVQLEQT